MINYFTKAIALTQTFNLKANIKEFTKNFPGGGGANAAKSTLKHIKEYHKPVKNQNTRSEVKM